MRLLAASVGLLLGLAAAEGTGNHPEWPRWCGKAYQPQFPSFDPGGQTVEPPALPGGPGLDVRLKPRYSIYLESESHAELVVDADISKWHGQPWPDLGTPDNAPAVHFEISIASGSGAIITDKLVVGSKSNVFAFSLARVQPSLSPYKVTLVGTSEDGSSNITATSELFLLPEKKTGSVTRLDNLNGGMLFRSRATGGKFEPFMPYGFYASCDKFLCDRDNLSKIKAYRDLGLNSMISLTTIFDSRPAYEYLDKLDLRFMYDLRGYYKNLTAVRQQVSAIKDFDAIYSYWGSDEPDGHQDPFNLVVEARDAIRQIDPYHPVSVTLNCQNYYFKEYSAGADFIMEDAYPVAINSTFSKWGTACNSTYGDCGCDNCQGGVQDVARRLDDLARYENWLGLWPKTKAHNPQSFHGEGYWPRDPTEEEAVAMSALALNHGAKAIASWVWPTSDVLAQVHGRFARAVANDPVRRMVTVGRPNRVRVERAESVDVAYWMVEDTNQVLVTVVNGGPEPVNGLVTVPLPAAVVPRTKDRVIWGNATWTLGNDEVQLGGVAAMSTNMVLLSARGDSYEM